MNSEEKLMSNEESLHIITEMIGRTRLKVSQGSFHLILWGWLILFCVVVEYVLIRFTTVASPWNIWFLTLAGALGSGLYGFLKGRRERVRTYADSIFMWTWLGFMPVGALLIIYLCIDRSFVLIPPFIMLVASLPTFISGIIIRFRPLIVGGIIMFLLSVTAFFAGPSVHHLAMAAAMLAGYLIPGYLIRKRFSS